MPEKITRRTALVATAAAAAVSSRLVAVEAGRTSASEPKICVFTKPFNSLSFDELADRIAELGFHGIEAPIRRGGHVDPSEVEDKLPKLHEALKKRDLEITVMASDINDLNDPESLRVIEMASALGIRRYRMKYLRYDLSRPVIDQLKEWRPRLRDLAALNRERRIQGLYQNHAGSSIFGAPIWDLKYALQGIPTEALGVAYDIRHATVEGGTSWPVTLNMILPHIAMLYVKDFRWDGPKVRNVALGEGRVDPSYLKTVLESGFRGPISLHEEYLGHRSPELVPKHLEAIRNDFETLKRWLQG